MSKWKSFRIWINKNDGSFYQVDNQKLTIYEVVGYLLFIASFIVYLLQEKIGLEETWVGWVLLSAGLVLVVVGVTKRYLDGKTT